MIHSRSIPSVLLPNLFEMFRFHFSLRFELIVIGHAHSLIFFVLLLFLPFQDFLSSVTVTTIGSTQTMLGIDVVGDSSSIGEDFRTVLAFYLNRIFVAQPFVSGEVGDWKELILH